MALVPKKPSGSGSRPVPPVLALPGVGAQHQSAPNTTRERSSSKDFTLPSPVPNTARLGSDSPSIDPAQAITQFQSQLTEHELTEIQSFSSVYYVGQNCDKKIPAPVSGQPNFGYDDDRGDYLFALRDHVNYRYEVISMLGKGSFGQVAKALDHRTGSYAALKVIRNKKRFHQQAEVEVRILSHLRDRDPEGKYGIIKVIESFTFRSHVCITYELLSINLYEHMKATKFYPLPLTTVKKIGASLLISLAFMWREGIIHCDLKPENILLRQPNRTAVKVIDLGSACFEHEKVYTYIQSRFYRAPEIILGIPYTRRIDLWSYACVLCELASGFPLFPGENEGEQLACIMEVLDVPPKYLLDEAPRRGQFFDTIGEAYIPKLVPNSRKKIRLPNTKPLSVFLGVEEDNPFVEFIRMFLAWDPEDRPPPEAAMRHPWICDAYVGITPKVPTTRSEAKRRAESKGDQKSGVPTLPNIGKKAARPTA